jgi:hypothetical protein
VKILDRFEHSVERLMEGSVGRLFRSPIQPAEIGRKLERAMLAKQVVSVGRTLVPNDFVVAMHPADMVLFTDFVSALSRQMESWLTEVAAERRVSFVDRVRVQIVGDDRVPRRSIGVEAIIAERPDSDVTGHARVQRTEVYRAMHRTPEVRPARLALRSTRGTGHPILIRMPLTSVGRAPDNDIVLPDGDVSRHHARLEYDSGRLTVQDLRSTNGTWVNGQKIERRVIGPGDEMTFGASRVVVLPYGDDES